MRAPAAVLLRLSRMQPIGLAKRSCRPRHCRHDSGYCR